MEEYDLELDRAVALIQKEKAKTVVIQLPEGLKPKATLIADVLHERTGAQVLIWMEQTFGACDIPELPVDVLIQWGHSSWLKD